MVIREVELQGKYSTTAHVALIRDLRSESPLGQLSYTFWSEDDEDPGEVPVELSDGTLLLAQSYARMGGPGWYHLRQLSKQNSSEREPFPDMTVVLADLDLGRASFHEPGTHPYTGIFIDAAPHMPLPRGAEPVDLAGPADDVDIDH